MDAHAASVELPLSIDARHLQRQVGHALGVGGDGRALLEADDCNSVALSDLRLTPAGDRLRVSMAVRADAGAAVFGQCLGMTQWHGRMDVALHPYLADDGLAVLLRADSAELRRSDGTEGLLARPTRLLAERLVLPRLDDARVDLRAALERMDETLEHMLAGGDAVPRLTERTRIGRVEVTEHGLAAELVFQVEPAMAPPAVPEAPLDAGELAEWHRLEDELDGFLTTIIAHLAAQAQSRDLRIELMGVLLDSRLAIAHALAVQDPEQRDPVRVLFVDAWDRLRPHLSTLAESGAVPGEEGLRLATFVAGADAIRALDALGPEYGFEVSRDGLRRLARMLLAEDAPASFTPLPLTVDPMMRELLDLDAPRPAPPESSAAPWWLRLLPAARASASTDSTADALRDLVPQLTGLDDYLRLVGALLEQEAERHLEGETRIPETYHSMFDPLLRATAWKETCWRHYVGSSAQPRVIRSPVGAVGMMQINGRVWRGVYELDRLEAEVQYNVAAGIEILEHYFVDYALRRGEHEHDGGAQNLVRATYAAYNGGPGHLSRYRREETPARLRAIDREFWRHYEQMQRESWPDVSSCYPV